MATKIGSFDGIVWVCSLHSQRPQWKHCHDLTVDALIFRLLDTNEVTVPGL